MKFSDNIKSILLKRNGTRKGGEVFSVKENQLDIKYSVDLRELVDVAVKKMVSDMNYYYIDDRSTDKELFFLDLSRGKMDNNGRTDILGFFYQDGKVVPYVIDSIIKDQND